MSEATPITFPIRVGSVDVGSNAIRMMVAEFSSPTDFQTIVVERQPVRLAHGVFVSGRLGDAGMAAAIVALQTFRAQFDALGVTAYRAVATSAVRESTNREEFLKQVKSESGIQLDLINGMEEARLVHLAVRHRMELGRKRWMLVDVGGGSVEVSLIDNRGILWSETHAMGSVRLLEDLTGTGVETGGFSRLIEEYVSTLRIPSGLRGNAPSGLIATGGSITTLARISGSKAKNGDGVTILPLVDLSDTIRRLVRLSYRQRVEELGLREDRADVIVPAAMLYQRLAALAAVQEIHIPNVGLREGLALDLVDDLATHRAHQDQKVQEVMTGALTLGARYMFDEPHGVRVCELALALFDQMTELHKLSETDRIILQTAALLHDIGQYVSNKQHHRHSYYLLSNSDLPGLSTRHMQMVANVARYHRKSEPQDHHESFAGLSAADQNRVRRLAAILRIADALDRDHLQRVRALRVTLGKTDLVLNIEGPDELLLDRWALQKKSGLFSKVFGMKVRVPARDAKEA